MREILFRGKLCKEINPQKPAGSWVEGGHYLGKRGACIHEEHACIGLSVISETVGQYTGLKDRNGMKIFEGDIVEVSITGFGEDRAFIKWSETECAFMMVRKIYGLHSLAKVNENPGCIKVIGNIHDNPELLKQGEGEA